MPWRRDRELLHSKASIPSSAGSGPKKDTADRAQMSEKRVRKLLTAAVKTRTRRKPLGFFKVRCRTGVGWFCMLSEIRIDNQVPLPLPVCSSISTAERQDGKDHRITKKVTFAPSRKHFPHQVVVQEPGTRLGHQAERVAPKGSLEMARVHETWLGSLITNHSARDGHLLLAAC